MSKRKGDEKKDSRIGMTLQISPRDVCVFEKVIASVHCGLSDRDQRDTKEDLEMREVSIKDWKKKEHWWLIGYNSLFKFWS